MGRKVENERKMKGVNKEREWHSCIKSELIEQTCVWCVYIDNMCAMKCVTRQRAIWANQIYYIDFVSVTSIETLR